MSVIGLYLLPQQCLKYIISFNSFVISHYTNKYLKSCAVIELNSSQKLQSPLWDKVLNLSVTFRHLFYMYVNWLSDLLVSLSINLSAFRWQSFKIPYTCFSLLGLVFIYSFILSPRKNTKVKITSPDGNSVNFNIVAGGLQIDTYLFIICQDYVLRTSIDLVKEMVSSWQRISRTNNYGRGQRRWYSASIKYTLPRWNPATWSGISSC